MKCIYIIKNQSIKFYLDIFLTVVDYQQRLFPPTLFPAQPKITGVRIVFIQKLLLFSLFSCIFEQ